MELIDGGPLGKLWDKWFPKWESKVIVPSGKVLENFWEIMGPRSIGGPNMCYPRASTHKILLATERDLKYYLQRNQIDKYKYGPGFMCAGFAGSLWADAGKEAARYNLLGRPSVGMMWLFEPEPHALAWAFDINWRFYVIQVQKDEMRNLLPSDKGMNWAVI